MIGYQVILKESQLAKLRFQSKQEEERHNCPFCDDTTGHCYVNRDKKVWHCFKCGRSGYFEASTYTVQWPWKEYSIPITIAQEKEVRTLPRMIPLIRDHAVLRDRDEMDLFDRAKEYLFSRGIIEEEIKNNKLGWCPDKHGPYADGIVFPVDGEKYFVCRKLEGKPKYVNAPWPKGESLYTCCDVKLGQWWNPIIITEGPIDCIKARRTGYPSVALLGKQANKDQLVRLVSKVMITTEWHETNNRFITLLDPDAWTASINLRLGLLAMADQLGKKIQVVNVFLDAWDPGDMETEELKKVIDNAVKRFK